jgi:hypothetical protein
MGRVRWMQSDRNFLPLAFSLSILLFAFGSLASEILRARTRKSTSRAHARPLPRERRFTWL